MPLLRCPKFLRCPATDACNFERGYSLILFLPPSAALDLRPTSARLVCTPPLHTCRGDPRGRPPRLAPHLLPHSHRAGCTHPAALLVLCHCEPVTDVTGCSNPHPLVPHLLLCFRRGRCPRRPEPVLHHPRVKHHVIAKPVRTLAVAIRAPCTALPSLRKGHSPPPTKMR